MIIHEGVVGENRASPLERGSLKEIFGIGGILPWSDLGRVFSEWTTYAHIHPLTLPLYVFNAG